MCVSNQINTLPSNLKTRKLASTVKFPSLLSLIASLSGLVGESTNFGKTIRNSAITLPGL